MNPLTKGILIGFVVGLIAGLLIARLLLGSRGRARGSSAPKPISNEFAALLGGADPVASAAASPATVGEVARLRQDLRTKFLHDEQKVHDAVQLERERNPGGSEADLLRAAIHRWERDNR